LGASEKPNFNPCLKSLPQHWKGKNLISTGTPLA
jgi:hypothetical protein